ncbi:MAG: hypothetical protein WCF85_10450 [Rhodospirillaceae bacterium]
MNRFLVTIVFRELNVSPEKISERLKKIGEVRPAITGQLVGDIVLFFLKTYAGCHEVASELRGMSSDLRKPKMPPVIGDKDELLIVDVGANTIIPSEGTKMWLFRK